MTLPILKQIADLHGKSQDDLKALRRVYFNVPPPAYRRGFLIRGPAQRIQELTFGGLSGSHRDRLEALVEDRAKGRGRKPAENPRREGHLLPGAKLMRNGKGPPTTSPCWRTASSIRGGATARCRRSPARSPEPAGTAGYFLAVSTRQSGIGGPPDEQGHPEDPLRGLLPQEQRNIGFAPPSGAGGLEQEFNSLDAQRDAGLAYISSQVGEGWIAVADRYEDGGFSGGNLERPALKRLLGDIERGLVDCVVVYKVDRLTRALTDFAKLVDLFDKHGVSFVSVTQSFNTTTSMGRLTLNVLLSFAQYERELAGERIRDKFAASRKRGLWMGGVPPLGYDVIARKLVVNGTEADPAPLIFKHFFLEIGSATRLVEEPAAGGHTTKSWTTKDGKARTGGPIDKTFVYKLLNNRVYLGEAVHKGVAHPGEHDAVIDRRN